MQRQFHTRWAFLFWFIVNRWVYSGLHRCILQMHMYFINTRNTLISCLFRIICWSLIEKNVSCQTGCCGALDRTPENATLYADGELRLNCNSTIDNPVVWFFTEEGSDTRQKLTTGGALTASFKDTFMIHPVSKYDLIAIMTNVTEPYCGYYECVDDQNKRGAETANATVASKYSVVPKVKQPPTRR